jgi:acetaldehyde dehydrogenase (acetylating)
LYSYWGSCSSGGWDETNIQMTLNSVLDAVQANVPGRRLHRWQVGSIPFTAQISV